MHEARARDEIVAAGRRLQERGLLWSIEGNLSIRLSDGRLVATPTGALKGSLDPSSLVLTDAAGRAISGGRPSSEMPMHVAVYEKRPDVHAIVHAHPPIATGWAVAGRALPTTVLAESIALFGCVPLAPYATPSTEDLAATARDALAEAGAALLSNHGAITAGEDMATAVERMVQLEHFARISLVAELLGGPRELAPADVDRIRDLMGGAPMPAACYPSTVESGTITLTKDQLVRLIADAVRALR